MSASAASSDRSRRDEAPESGAALAWCEHCGRVVADDEVINAADGQLRCPDCGDELVLTAEDEAPRAPWHFKVLLVGTIGYLIYRLIWFILWLSHHA